MDLNDVATRVLFSKLLQRHYWYSNAETALFPAEHISITVVCFHCECDAND